CGTSGAGGVVAARAEYAPAGPNRRAGSVKPPAGGVHSGLAGHRAPHVRDTGPLPRGTPHPARAGSPGGPARGLPGTSHVGRPSSRARSARHSWRAGVRASELTRADRPSAGASARRLQPSTHTRADPPAARAGHPDPSRARPSVPQRGLPGTSHVGCPPSRARSARHPTRGIPVRNAGFRSVTWDSGLPRADPPDRPRGGPAGRPRGLSGAQRAGRPAFTRAQTRPLARRVPAGASRAATPAPRPWPAPPAPHPSRAPHTRHRAPRVLAVGVARDLRELRRCSGRLHTVAGPAETAGGTTASAIEGTYMVMGHTATAQAGSGGLTATEHRLANGLRVVLSEDHLTPVAAVCLWYDVGSRHEVKGRTGLAHLFEHLMFQGSAQVKGNGHFELVQGAGGSLNGTTSFERTHYFETMPAHQLELALWLEADR